MKCKIGSANILCLLTVCSMWIIPLGCAHFRSSTQVVLDKPPYVHGRGMEIESQGFKLGHLPVVMDRRSEDPRTKETWDALLSAMGQFLEDKGWSAPLDPIDMPIKEAPDIFVGHEDMFDAPISGASYSDEDEIPPMVLYALNGSESWKARASEIAEASGVDGILFLTVGLTEYLIRQKTILGKKELALGTGYSVPVKWLTSLEDPIDVLHVAGALLDRTGKIIRFGAEGIVSAEPASFFESIISLRNSISDETIRMLITDKRREDLDGNPLSYRVAFQNLIAQLLQRQSLIIK